MRVGKISSARQRPVEMNDGKPCKEERGKDTGCLMVLHLRQVSHDLAVPPTLVLLPQLADV
ncbi:hypothetical protein E2C01_091685 [Portunus trituberculatus]|uniref:Uncharacterized protein n=1 Tax=Portunus trituberculatus TaxID=210409 RepID=A0A5B7JTI3_PORTR|nr:hypothetical protein [Portunus trituberculatus]